MHLVVHERDTIVRPRHAVQRDRNQHSHTLRLRARPPAAGLKCGAALASTMVKIKEIINIIAQN